MKNGKCNLHGGRTPNGDDWHRPRWPDKGAPDAVEKLNRKLADHEKANRRRAKRQAAMTPEELRAHKHWQVSHKPGSSTLRARRRAQHRQATEAHETMSQLRSAREITDPEYLAIIAKLDAAKRRQAEMRSAALLEANWDKGVFA
jgi:hypothetical protein